MNTVNDIRTNNFDLLRLLAASQVVLFHLIEHLNLSFSGIAENFLHILRFFPGVPIFFVISGFLISLSLERNPNLKIYAINRGLRVFPGLWICFLISIITVTITGYWQNARVAIDQAIVWVLAQISVGQFFNPDFMREYGVGTLNGSLWTIPVELQFYVVLPIIYLIIAHFKPRTQNIILLALIVLFAILSLLCLEYKHSNPENIETKLTFITFVPYLYMFLTGTLIQRLLPVLRPILEGKALYWLISYIISSYLIGMITELEVAGNYLNPLSFFILAFVIISCGFSYPVVSEQLLRGNDISYGIYLYHMVIANMFVELSLTGSLSFFFFACTITILLAVLSWQFVEKRALALKRKSSQSLTNA